MARGSATARRAEDLLGRAVVATAAVAGGDVCTATKLRLSDNTTVVMKTLPGTAGGAPSGFFETEAAGLRWLGEGAPDGGLRVPEVRAVAPDCLILAWVDHGPSPSPEQAEAFGRGLARTHRHDPPSGFGADVDGFVARLPLPNRTAPTWAEFFAVRRVLPYLKLARDRGAVTPAQAAVVEGLVGRLPALLPAEAPSRLHGDLWNGNVLWDPDGGAWLVDPAAYAGHREADLAMLALFGLAHLPRALAAYHEEHPLAEGWQDRLDLHQLFPLLVHACLFGGSYGPRAAAVAARYV